MSDSNGKPVYRRRTEPRAKVIADSGERKDLTATDERALAQRPVTRGDCIGGIRPCPWVGCKYSLYLDVNPKTGSIKLNFPHLEPDQLAETCALDVAARGEHDLDDIGLLINATRARVGQIVDQAVRNPDLIRNMSAFLQTP